MKLDFNEKSTSFILRVANCSIVAILLWAIESTAIIFLSKHNTIFFQAACDVDTRTFKRKHFSFLIMLCKLSSKDYTR